MSLKTTIWDWVRWLKNPEQKPMKNYQKADTERLMMPPNQYPCARCGHSFYFDGGKPPVMLCADCQESLRMFNITSPAQSESGEYACSRCNQTYHCETRPPYNLCPDCQVTDAETQQCRPRILKTSPLPATVDGRPRRNNSDWWNGAEIAIHNAMDAVEATGAHPLLTEASTLLSQAAERVADYLELAEQPAPSVSETCKVIRGKFDELEAIPYKWTPEALERVKALTKQIEDLTLQLSRSMGAGQGGLNEGQSK